MYVLGGATYLLQVKCVEDIGQWSLLFMILIQLVFLTAEKISPTKMYISIRESNQDGAYNKVYTVTIEL